VSAEPPQSAAAPASVWPTFAELMLVLLLAALDQTIVSTALPTIVGELGGLSHLSWVVTAYLLASTVVTPIYGKLGDLYGRKIVLQSAIVVFLAGSAACGLSRNMVELIAFRFVQGIGGGGLMVTTIAVIGDLIPPRERGRYQGLFGGVWSLATLIGPLLGGFFVDQLTWRWIFYINLPLGLVALAVIAGTFRLRPARRAHAVDYLGAALLAGALGCVILFTSLGGTTLPWDSPAMIALLALASILAAGFAIAEKSAREPILPLSLFANAIFVVCCALGFIVGLALFGSVTYLPLYLQVVRAVSPTSSGLQLAPMMIGVLLTSIVCGQLISRFGRYKPFPIVGTALMTAGLLLLWRMPADAATARIVLYMLVLGIGLGMVMQVLVLAVQNGVDYEQLGVATSGAILFRSIGGAIGVALFGAIFTNRFRIELAHLLPGGSDASLLASPASIRQLPAGLHGAAVQAFSAALHQVFLVAGSIAALAFALSWFLREVPLRRTLADHRQPTPVLADPDR
jgi:EmrB/QacA subfamily drug resistance transporter